jgi:hypothetical protein
MSAEPHDTMDAKVIRLNLSFQDGIFHYFIQSWKYFVHDTPPFMLANLRKREDLGHGHVTKQNAQCRLHIRHHITSSQ